MWSDDYSSQALPIRGHQPQGQAGDSASSVHWTWCCNCRPSGEFGITWPSCSSLHSGLSWAGQPPCGALIFFPIFQIFHRAPCLHMPPGCNECSCCCSYNVSGHDVLLGLILVLHLHSCITSIKESQGKNTPNKATRNVNPEPSQVNSKTLPLACSKKTSMQLCLCLLATNMIGHVMTDKQGTKQANRLM